MKILMFLAVLMTISGIVLGDVILAIVGVVAVACAGTDALSKTQPAVQVRL